MIPIASLLALVHNYNIFLIIIIITMLGGFDVNFMDDVGQTLLNWASAFGTLEMVRHFLGMVLS